MDLTFSVGEQPAHGYLAVPDNGTGPGVLLFHAWWGLTPFFKGFCDELAAQGFVVFAPDLMDGKTAQTVPEAEALPRDAARMQAVAFASLDFLRARAERTGETVSSVGFSMGVQWAVALATHQPNAVSALGLFYDDSLFYEDMGLNIPAPVRVQAHFGEADHFVPIADVRAWEAALAAHNRPAEIYVYEGAGHWFIESNYPEHYKPEAAEQAKQRLFAFLANI